MLLNFMTLDGQEQEQMYAAWTVLRDLEGKCLAIGLLQNSFLCLGSDVEPFYYCCGLHMHI